jgi:hypothetical protein
MKKTYLGFILLLTSTAFAAQPISFTYQGKALNAAGTAPLTTTVSFTLSITDPSGACTLYQESQSNINLSTTNGLFGLQVGSNIGDPKRTASDPGLVMSQIFANAGTQLVPASGSCTGYTPAVGDIRRLHVIITPSAGSPITISPDLSINAVPNSMVADTLQGSSLTQIYVPVGMILPFTGSTCPTGYLAADGSSYSTTAAAYKNLFNVMGYTYGGSGASFTVPNTSGIFLRGSGTQTIGSVSYSTTEGAIQSDQFQGHVMGSPSQPYVINGPGGINTNGGSFGQNSSVTGGPVSDGTNGAPRYGLETRPANLGVKYCIKD